MRKTSPQLGGQRWYNQWVSGLAVHNAVLANEGLLIKSGFMRSLSQLMLGGFTHDFTKIPSVVISFYLFSTRLIVSTTKGD